jgi:predicted GIY-YIG superfamily endonuclease
MNRFYTGVSQDDLQERILKHNLHTYGTHRYTAKTNDWELYYCIACSSFSLAVKTAYFFHPAIDAGGGLFENEQIIVPKPVKNF